MARRLPTGAQPFGGVARRWLGVVQGGFGQLQPLVLPQLGQA